MHAESKFGPVHSWINDEGAIEGYQFASPYQLKNGCISFDLMTDSRVESPLA